MANAEVLYGVLRQILKVEHASLKWYLRKGIKGNKGQRAVKYIPLIQREREMFYLTTHSTHFIYCYMASLHHSDSEKGKPAAAT